MIDHEIVEAVINGVEVYYSPDRIEKKMVPDGFHRYEIRSSDDGKKWATLENFVGVNFAGTVLSDTAFEFDQEFKFPCQPTSRWLDIVSYSVEESDDEDEWDDEGYRFDVYDHNKEVIGSAECYEDALYIYNNDHTAMFVYDWEEDKIVAGTDIE